MNGEYIDPELIIEALSNPDVQERIAQMSAYPDRMRQAGGLMQQGAGMFNAQPQAQGMRVGGTYVASSPLEHAADAMRPILGALVERNAMQKQQDLMSQDIAARRGIAGAMADAMRRARSVAAPGTQQPDVLGDYGLTPGIL